MAKASIAPFLRPHPNRFNLISLELADGEGYRPLPDTLPEWDLNSDLNVRATLTLDLDQAFVDCKLGVDAKFAVVLAWRCIGNSLRGVLNTTIVPYQLGIQTVVLQGIVSGAMLSAAVETVIRITLFDSGQYPSRLSPRVSGSVLWEESRMVILEGTGFRFPMEMVSFKASFAWLPSNAGWFLDWDREDLTRPLLGGMRLYINSDHVRIRAAVIGTSEADKVIQESISYAVARTLIVSLLETDDLSAPDYDYPDGSIGKALERLVSISFPAFNQSEVAEMQKQNPEVFDSLLQATLRLFVQETA